MKIIIIGCGKVGRVPDRAAGFLKTITSLLLTRIPKKIQTITEDLDVMGISGNGAGITTHFGSWDCAG